jgi:hypothetical protein
MEQMDSHVAKCPPGRTFNRDFRCAAHEIGHMLLARLLGDRVDGVTIDPGDGYEGQVWGNLGALKHSRPAMLMSIGLQILRAE